MAPQRPAARRARPFYSPPTLALRQLAIGASLALMTRASPGTAASWLRRLPRLLKGLGGMVKLGCFGCHPHIVWEVTLKCNLKCLHCEVGGGEERYEELETGEALSLIDSLAELKEFRVLVLSGGEPLLRGDLFKIISYARDVGFSVFIATNGTLINRRVAKLLRHYDVGVVVSLDATTPSVHDYIRGVLGAFNRCVEGLRSLRSEPGLWAHLNITASKINVDEVPKLLDYSDALGAITDFVYSFVPAGRGGRVAGVELEEGEMLQLLEAISSRQRRIRAIVAPVALPQYWAYLSTRAGLRSRLLVEALSQLFCGCIAGSGMIYVKPNGEVWPCPFLQIPLGNALEGVARVWRGEALSSLRDRSRLKGRCGSCTYRQLCGGCRARAFLSTGDYLEQDPKCPLRALSLAQ
ncbi:MAG: radical SAM protein [Candidatus Nezhaarchaeota archaeon]|nr:radical SAM protein [Candidatus Nezhaarchaeota archaeon]